MIALFRIDDRLIHAQVVIGWGRHLKPDRIVIADDYVASNEWEKELFMTAVSPDIKVSILSLREAVNHIQGDVFGKEKIILLVKGPREVLDLMEMGLEADEVNVGGLHYVEGKEKVLDNVYLDQSDRAALRELVKKGITLEARALPESEKIILNSRVV
ncbi:MAG: PTS sugar transporter subunit IIB [Candidatus Krumholzibacteriota bacterium]|nr:PTS sugar transporter subunit IIB [Candidatus Krumholzibacteriota bacterium]